MGLNDAAEMLEVAKAENVRLERELAEWVETGRVFARLYVRAEQDVQSLRGERDRARETAVRLEQELAAVQSDMAGATEVGEPWAYPSTPGQFAARWNARTEEDRVEWLSRFTEVSERAHACWVGGHEGQARLVEELLPKVGVLEAQRRNLVALLDGWANRMVRVRAGVLHRSELTAIEECRREVARVIECGPPIVAEPVEGWRPAGGLVSE